MKFTEFLKVASKRHKGLNRPLFLAVAQRLRRLRHEEHYNQAEVIERTDCGTTACIGGHTVIAAGCPISAAINELYAEGKNGGVLSSAQKLLGLTDKQGVRLFDGGGLGWPAPFNTRYKDAKFCNSNERPSRVAADLLEAIAEGKVKL